MPRAKAKSKEAKVEDRIIMGMDHYSSTAVGVAQGMESVAFLTITAHGLEHEVWPREKFLREFNRDLLYEEWAALIKYREIAMRKEENSDPAIALLERMFKMKIKDLDGKEMSELLAMHNELAKSLGKKEVAKFKSIEAVKIAIVQLSNGKPAAKSKAAKATGKGQEGRPRTGVGAFAKGLLAKGKSNTETLEAVKKEFPKNSTTLSCIAYYRAHMVKDGLLAKTVKAPKAKKEAKAKAKAKPAKKAAKAPVEQTTAPATA
jgi:hypothetical protein